jgi:hypothetical protein
VLKKKNLGQFQRIIELFTQKIVNKLSKIWVWDPGSGKNLFRIPDPGSRIPDPGVKKAPDPGSGSATLILSVHNRGIEGLLNGYAMSYPIYEYFAIPNNVLAYLKGHYHEIMFVFGRESLLLDI